MNHTTDRNRRRFIRNTSLGLAGMPFITHNFLNVPPSDKIRVAHVGINGMGRGHINWFARMPDVDTVALCDVDAYHLAEAEKLRSSLQPNVKAEGYGDYRHIIDRKDIDVVTCATPDHWHALVAIHAMESGKDVYGEKPLSYSVREGQVMLAAQKKHRAIFQLGTQIHAGDNYHRVAEIVQSGVLGKIHTVRLWKTGGTDGMGFPPNQEPPPHLDWNMWLGPAPYTPYTPIKCHRTYRSFFNFSGGVFADFWCHIADIMFMSLQPTGLRSIEARGEVPTNGIANTPKWIDVDYKFEDLDVYWTTTPPDVSGAAEMGIGAHFEGDKGSLTCDYDTRRIRIGNETVEDLDEVHRSIPRSPGHQRNFLDSVKSRKEPESNLTYAREMTLPMHLGLISFRLKRPLKWDSRAERFTGDAEADDMLFRPYRLPFKLPNYG